MYGKVNFGNVEVEMKATMATNVLFRRIFHFDVLNTLAKIRNFKEFDEETQIEEGLNTRELISKLGFIMAMQAKNADYSKLSIEDYYKWLDEFDVCDLPLEDIIFIYKKNEETTSDPKK